ncbi:MAG TPA: methionine adenosyltransferase domain-containing protein [Pyrinomonadaceae bacterium]|jgi:S-adenosylmethionine synthetase
MLNTEKTWRTAEHVSEGHPDKFCDQVADRILDEALELAGDDDSRSRVRTAIECLAKDNLLIVSGEVGFSKKIKSEINIHDLAREVWKRVGYGNGDELTVVNHLRHQSGHISQGVDIGGAGDQGIMVGYATNEKINGSDNKLLMPLEWVLARDICYELRNLRLQNKLSWLRTDCKSQVTVNEKGEVVGVIIAAQHAEVAGSDHEKAGELEEMERAIIGQAIQPVIFPDLSSANSLKIDKQKEEFKTGEKKEVRRHYFINGITDSPIRVVINGTGEFAIGGTIGDAGVVGRKIVVDAYGPQIPVGGGAYSGKDPTKVDRSAAYMARYIAKTLVAEGEANQCLVKIAYGIGRREPEMFTVITDKGALSSKFHSRFIELLSPKRIIDGFRLRKPTGKFEKADPQTWSYFQTAAYGHYGRDIFPWEQPGSFIE